MRKISIGDKCKECPAILLEDNCVYQGFNIRGICRDCRNKKEKIRSQIPDYKRNQHLKHSYGINLYTYNKMRELHLDGCAICKQPCKSGMKLAVDHNKVTGEVRGLLCNTCNMALGMLQEDEDLIWNMLEYIKKYNKAVA